MNKLFTKVAKLVLGLSLAAGVGVVFSKKPIESKAENYSFKYEYSDLGDLLEGDFLDASSYWKVPQTSGNSATMEIPITYQPTSDITLTFRLATFGSGTNPSSSNTTITALGTESGSNWSGNGVSLYPSSSTYVNGVMTITKPNNPTTLGGLTVTVGVNSGVRIFRFQSLSVSYTYTNGSSVAVTGVSLNKNSTSISVGSKETLIATVVPENASDNSVSWSTSDGSVATVVDGEVTGVAEGTADITATTTDGNFTATCAVTVTAPVYAQFEKITSADDLEAGKKYVIGNANGSVFMSTTQNTNNRGQTAGTISNNRVAETASMEVIELGGSSNAWILEATKTAGYLSSNSNSNNNLKTESSANQDKSKWTITFSNGVPSVQANYYDRKDLRYNSSSSIFSCYAVGGQGAITLWKEYEDSGLEDKQITFTSDANISLNLVDNTTSQIAGINVQGCTFTSNDSEVASVDNNGEITAEGYGSTTIIISHADDSTYHYISATVTVTVIRVYDYSTSFSVVSLETAYNNTPQEGDSVKMKVVGHIASMDSSNTQYGNGYLENTNSPGKSLRIYGMYDVDGNRGTSMSNPTVPVAHDVVVLEGVFCFFTNSKSNETTWEIKDAVLRQKNGVAYKAIESLAVKTAPTKTTYNSGETFDPTGLVITVSYDDNSSIDVSYADHSSDFSFSPDLSTSLTTSNGSVTITYKHQTVDQAITVNAAAAVLSVLVSPSTASVDIGDTTSLTATVSVEGGAAQTVNWTSSSDSIATVDADGVVTGVAKGTATITATSTVDNTKSSSATITVTDPNELSYTWDLTTDSYSSADNDSVVWSSSAANVVVAKGSSSTNANNYLPTTRSTTRVLYNGQSMTITPNTSYTIVSVVFTAAASVGNLSGLTWTNASSAVNGDVVTVTPTNGSISMSVTGAGYVGLSSIKVNYLHDVSTKSLSISDSSITVNVGETDTTTLIETNFTGGTYTVDTDSCATVSVSGTTVSVEGLAQGSHQFTINETTYSLSVTLDVTVNQPATGGCIADGYYFISDFDGAGALTRGTVTYNTPKEVTDEKEAASWKFTLVDSSTNTYTISAEVNSTTIYLNGTNGQSKGLKTQAESANWIITPVEGVTNGFTLYSVDGSRYISVYNDADFRTYANAYTLILTEEKVMFSDNFLDSFTAGCNINGGYTAANMDWSAARTQFETLSTNNQKAFKDAEYTRSGSGANTIITPVSGVDQKIANVVARYDYIVGMHGTTTFADFMNRNPSPLGGLNVNLSTFVGKNTNTVAIIVIVSLVSVTAIGGYFFLKKRREQN